MPSFANSHLGACVLFCLAVTAACAGCSGGSSGGGALPAGQSSPWLWEADFAADPFLAATTDQVVLLDLTAGLDFEQAHSIPLAYTARDQGKKVLCLDPSDPYLVRAVLKDSTGREVAAVTRDSGAAVFDAPAGSCRLTIYHDATLVPLAGSVGFLRHKAQEPPELPAKAGLTPLPRSYLYPAYVALKLSGGNYDGRYLSMAWAYNTWLGKAVAPGDDGGAFSQRLQLFGLESADTICDHNAPPPFVGNVRPHTWTHDDGQHYLGIGSMYCPQWPDACPASQDNQPDPGYFMLPAFESTGALLPLGVRDMGGGDMELWCYVMPGLGCSPLYLAENGYLYYSNFSSDVPISDFRIDTRFRFYRDGTRINRAELARGEVALYSGENYTGTAVVLASSFKELNILSLFDVKSIAFGLFTDTTIAFFQQPGLAGEAFLTVGINTPSIDLHAADVGSISIFASDKVLLSTRKCPYCNLAGVNLSGRDLQKVDLRYANLMALAAHLADFSGANMAHSILSGATLSNTNLSGASLASATLNGNGGLQLKAASLSGSYMKNANLASADLGGADLSNVSFHSTPNAPDGCSADPSNPDFTDSCSSAVGCNLNFTDCSGAYMAGLDLSNAFGTAVNFKGSVLTGAHLGGARFDWDKTSTKATSFESVFLDGVDLSQATISRADFSSAYVDPYNDNNGCVEFILSKDHATFPGYDSSYGATPCVMFGYADVPTVLAPMDANTTCPDGSRGPCDDYAWTHPTTARSAADQKNGLCTPALCANSYWGW